MKVRFIADYDFNGEIVDGLVRREPSIDFLTGFEAGLEGIPDRDVLGKRLTKAACLSPMTAARCRTTSVNSSRIGTVLES
jgi:hypothetical protein